MLDSLNHHSSSGFTLMELMVVLIILSLTMGLSLGFMHGDTQNQDIKANYRRLYALFSNLRHQALLERTRYTLHISLDGFEQSQYWIEKNTDSTPKQQARKNAFLQGNVRLKGIEQQAERLDNSGIIQIPFSAQGITLPTRFYITDNRTDYLLTLQAFSPDLILEEHKTRM